MPDEFKSFFEKVFNPKVDITVNMGPCSFRLISNVDNFVAQKYFSQHSIKIYANDAVDFGLYCVSLKESGLTKNKLVDFVDKSCRSGQFSNGYYVTDHFDKPVYLVSRGNSYYIFGEKLEHLVWPYFVKYFILLHSIQNKSLFLKAASFSINSKATLLLGRGSSGKTVFLSSMCLNGADFISNSHVIIKRQAIYGVTSAMRIRPQPWCENLFDKDKYHGIKRGEIIVDPYSVFRTNTQQHCSVKNICVLNFNGSKFHKIEKVSQRVVYDYAEQFSLGINVYRLEEDLLDFYKNDIDMFSKNYSLMKKRLFYLIKQCNCYFISSDVLNAKYRNEIFSLLS